MGLFSFTQELAMDLGTANTIITCNDKMVVDEPSVIALDARSEKVLAVGRRHVRCTKRPIRIFVRSVRSAKVSLPTSTLPSR